MSEVIEPLDPADAAAIAEGVIAPQDARFVDEFGTDTDLDSERLVLLDDRDSTEVGSVGDSENDLDLHGDGRFGSLNSHDTPIRVSPEVSVAAFAGPTKKNAAVQ
ncbi:hypothetical protein AAGW05_14955 [Arthrobacter sp. LAPM80]|uniref:hypothetical protein n=1 Tax=Arthrobacter sp. LAPM80 TaxID=3141788 RepID=UPI00398B76BD